MGEGSFFGTLRKPDRIVCRSPTVREGYEKAKPFLTVGLLLRSSLTVELLPRSSLTVGLLPLFAGTRQSLALIDRQTNQVAVVQFCRRPQ